jgi:hypothetical protein
LASSLEKLEDLTKTTNQLADYRLFRIDTVALWARGLALWEAFLALMLLAGVWPRTAAVMAAVTFLGFAGLLGYRIRTRGSNIQCGCGGIFGDQEISWRLVWRSSLLCVIALLGVATPQGWPAHWLPMLLAAFGITVLVWVYSTVWATGSLALQVEQQATGVRS